jgi:metal-responsive CopG/Arc/MetJ family transcriptional regulator
MENEPLDQRMQLVISKGQLGEIDNWRRKQDPIPSRSEAVRRLVEHGLAAESGSYARRINVSVSKQESKPTRTTVSVKKG